jgi:hypothetical protein
METTTNRIGNFILYKKEQNGYVEYKHLNAQYICSPLENGKYLLTAVTPKYGRQLWSEIVSIERIKSI